MSGKSPRARSAAQHEQPHGMVRHSQLVGTYGPGAMMDLVHDAVLIGGTDLWHDPAPYIIQEPRLRDTLAQRLGKDVRLSIEAPFRAPPTGKGDQLDYRCGVSAILFPGWMVCQNGSCRALAQLGQLDKVGDKRLHRCDDRSKHAAVPVRFVAACPHGHIEDFPWRHFVHAEGQASCPGSALQLREGSTGDFSEIEVLCKGCGARRQLSKALAKDSNPPCRGERPWLGADAREPCGRPLRLLVRSASNGYFPKVVSALSIPERQHAVDDAVQRFWDNLEEADAEALPILRKTNKKLREAFKDYADDDVLACIARRKAGGIPERQELRTAEFEQLVAQPREKVGALPGPTEHDFFARTLNATALPGGVAQVVLVHRLREVRALVGFTRLEPESPDLQGTFLDIKTAQLGQIQNWLPATEVKGEGVFVALDEEALRAWEGRPAVRAREAALGAAHARWKETLTAGAGLAFPGARFYLLHALSHLLMSAISMECGYPASSIRERIYCQRGERPMAGILLSTGAANSEGTLGGLVDQARAFTEHLRRAWDLAQLCSNDPGCADHVPDDPLDDRSLEGAACHSCLYVAEPSCERFNSFLDRTLVAPTLKDAALAFLVDRP